MFFSNYLLMCSIHVQSAKISARQKHYFILQDPSYSLVPYEKTDLTPLDPKSPRYTSQGSSVIFSPPPTASASSSGTQARDPL